MKKFLSLFLSCVMLFSMATFASAEDAGVTIEYPDTLQAMICLPVTYCSTAGINIIDNLNALADLIMAHFAQ